MITKKMQPLLAILALPLLLGACKKSPTPFPEVSEPYAITHAPGEHFLANYFGINAWSPDGRFVCVLETTFSGRLAEA